jgi:hypothetical protein
MKIAPNQMCMMAKLKHGISETMLGFSCGKDSLACWCALAENGIKVYPVYHYIFPGLSFVERALDYYEKRFKTEIIRAPHPWLCSILYWGAFTDPQGMRTLTEQGYTFHHRSYRQMENDVRESLKKPDLWVAVGMKMTDSLNRLCTIGKHAGFDKGAKRWYPLAYGSDRVAIEILRQHNMPVPDDYWIWKHSFDIITTEYAQGLAKHYPEDWKRILEYFPLLESQLLRATI